MKRIVQTLAVAAFVMSSQAAWPDQPTIPESIDDSPGRAMSSTYADRHLHDKNESADVAFPVSVDDNPGMFVRATDAERRQKETKDTRAERKAKPGG